MVELLPVIGGKVQMVCCTDDMNVRRLCPVKLWVEHQVPPPALVPQPQMRQPAFLNAPVYDSRDFNAMARLFMDLFRGNPEVCAKRRPNGSYGPYCVASWSPSCLIRQRKEEEKAQGKKSKSPHIECNASSCKKFIPLNEADLVMHLRGNKEDCSDVLGIYPMMPGNLTVLLALDFDEEQWEEDVTALRQVCRRIGLEPAVEKSRSGKGAHIWFFFSEPVAASKARRLGRGLLTRTMDRCGLSFESYDRMFPAQDSLSLNGIGNLIALPLQGKAVRNGNSMFVDDRFVPYPDQFAYLSTRTKITPQRLQDLLSELGPDAEESRAFQPAQAFRQAAWPPLAGSSKSISRSDFPDTLRIRLDSGVTVDTEGITPAGLNRLRRLAVFKNPLYYQNRFHYRRLGDATYEPYAFAEYAGDEHFLYLPRGRVEALLDLMQQFGVPVSVEDVRTLGQALDVTFTGEMKPLQEEALREMLKHDTGVLEAVTGFGKTRVGVAMIAERRVSTLIIVQKNTLKKQWVTELVTNLSAGSGDISDLVHVYPTSGKKGKDLSGLIDIVTVQFLKNRAPELYAGRYGMVLVDESHHAGADTSDKILNILRARYVYGMSATPERADGKEPIEFCCCGPVRYQAVSVNPGLRQVVIERRTDVVLRDGLTWNELNDELQDIDARNRMIVDDALSTVAEGRTPILMTQRVKHAEMLTSMLKEKVPNVFLLVGGGKGTKAVEEMRAVPDNEQLAAVATIPFLGEGFDYPRLDTLLICLPCSWKGTVAQYVGRLHRNYPGKAEVRILDYVDEKVPDLNRSYRKRCREYLNQGYTVMRGKGRTVEHILDGGSYLESFKRDLEHSLDSIWIVSSAVQEKQAGELMPVFQAALERGVRITVESVVPAGKGRAAAESILQKLEKMGVEVVKNLHWLQECAVIDSYIGWHGDIVLLAENGKENTAFRFESRQAASDLRNGVENMKNDTGEQLSLDM